MFYWMNYNFYSSVHKHRECRLNQQYKGCKSPKGQVQTGPWTHARMVKKQYSEGLGCPPFFSLYRVECFSWYWVGRLDWKKKPKKNHKKAWNRKPWYARRQDDIGFTKYTIYCKNDPGFVPVFLTMLLLCSFLRSKELFQVKNGLTKLLLFFVWK